MYLPCPFIYFCFQDPHNIDSYISRNILLPDLNNEFDQKNSTYYKNLSRLNKFVMIRFTDDTMVKPKGTAVSLDYPYF